MRHVPPCALTALFLALAPSPRPVAAAPDVVLYAADLTEVHGNWTLADDPSSPEGRALVSVDHGWSTRQAPHAAPDDYFEATFSAPAGSAYRVWLRLRAGANSKWNDSVWVQFEDAVDEDGEPIFTTGTSSGLLVNLESCYACGHSGWGWQDHAWWTGQSATVRFANTGTHTLRVQTREDGVSLDQIVLSPATYLDNSPGPDKDDTTILPQPTLPSQPAVTASAPPSNAETAQGSSPAIASVPPPAPSAGASSSSIPVLTWNVNVATQSDSGARQEMDTIAAMSPTPRIVVLQEASHRLSSTYAEELQSRTGMAWNGVFQGHCAPGAWDGAAGSCRSLQDEGVMILTTDAILTRDAKLLPYADCWHSARAAVRAAIDVGGVTVQVYGVHLQTGSCTDAAAARLNAIAALKNWASRAPGPAIVAGDFNEVSGSLEISDASAGMASMFTDTWPGAGSGPAETFPLPSPSMKIDFWFQDRGGRATAISSRVVTSATESDHFPLSATFVFRR